VRTRCPRTHNWRDRHTPHPSALAAGVPVGATYIAAVPGAPAVCVEASSTRPTSVRPAAGLCRCVRRTSSSFSPVLFGRAIQKRPFPLEPARIDGRYCIGDWQRNRGEGERRERGARYGSGTERTSNFLVGTRVCVLANIWGRCPTGALAGRASALGRLQIFAKVPQCRNQSRQRQLYSAALAPPPGKGAGVGMGASGAPRAVPAADTAVLTHFAPFKKKMDLGTC
jgi:hypothetical protein